MSLFNSCRLFLKLILFLILIGLSENSYSVTVLGTGTSALVGDDLIRSSPTKALVPVPKTVTE